MSKKPLSSEETSFIHSIAALRAEGTHYDVLGIDQSAPVKEVERAYFTLVRTWHPDRFYARDAGDLKGAIDENFDAFTQAYSVLKNDTQRAAYDRELRRKGLAPKPRPPISAADLPPPPEHVVSVARSGHSIRMSTTDTGDHPTSVSREAARPAGAPPAVQRLKQQLAQQLAKARGHFEAGRTAAAAGNWPQAESAYYLATRYDSRNTEYQNAFREAAQRARLGRVATYLQQGDTAASYGRYREAVALYQKACDCEPPEGTAFYKLSQILLSSEDDVRGAVDALRKAVLRDPKNIEWRWALAELYERAGLKQNALREARAVLELDPKHAKAGPLAKRLRAEV